ncbi:hypothetical protein OAT67_08830 [Bacteriovoracaceae bacterium]|nr:hypothetical protein [Bacteriovoracaceae bacterium]
MNSYSIKDFRERLDHWREETPEHRSIVVPDSMIEELLKLISMSSRSYVAKRLKIDSVLLAQNVKSFELKNEETMAFVEISPALTKSIDQQQSTSMASVEYISSTGTRINFHLPELSVSTISSILKDRAS